MKGALKYIVLFIIACLCSIAIYYYTNPEAKDNNFKIEIIKEKEN